MAENYTKRTNINIHLSQDGERPICDVLLNIFFFFGMHKNWIKITKTHNSLYIIDFASDSFVLMFINCCVCYKWVWSGGNVPSNMHQMRIFRSSRACAKYHSSPVIHFVVSNDYISEQWRPWSDCANAQADLGLRCSHMPEDMFSHDTVQMMFNSRKGRLC